MNKEVEEAREWLKEIRDFKKYFCSSFFASGSVCFNDEEKRKIDIILNYIQELECELHDLKVIEEAHQEENGSLRQENYELTAKVTDNICKGVEEEVLEEYRQKIKELEKTIQVLKDMRVRDTVPKYEIQDRIKELEELLVDPLCAKNVEYRIYELDRLLGKVE